MTATDLQKLVFLHTMSGNSDYYEFVPYKFGPYSFQLNEDLDILQRDGFVALEYIQNSKLIKAVGDSPKRATLRIAPERGNALIRKAYREYPYYTINSEITRRIFRGEELELFDNAKQAGIAPFIKNKREEQVLFTIGYEGKNIEGFINTLIQNNIKSLCDVRKNPLSRKFGFSKGKLKHITEAVGIKYFHIPDLGIESDKRSSLTTVEDYQCLFSNYEETLPNLSPLLQQVYSLLRADVRIALMCYERNPEMCHRHVISDYIANTHTVRSTDL